MCTRFLTQMIYCSALSHQTTLARGLLEKPSKMSIPGSPSSNKHIMCFDTFGEDGNNASLLMLLRKFTSFSWCICQYIFISHKKYGTVSISSLAIRYEKVWRPKGLISETLSVTTTENEEMEPKQNKHHLPCLHAWIQFILSNICFFEGGVNIWTLYKKHHLRKESEDINIVVFLPPVLKPFSTFLSRCFFQDLAPMVVKDWTPLVGIIWFQPPHSGRWEKILVEGNG